MKFTTKSLEDTKKLAEAFYKSVDADGVFVTLTGDIGAGKTQFVRNVLEFLGVKEKITSPSFVILNEYKSEKMPVFHFDLYRLEKNGLKSIVSELREYSKKGMLTFIEWADFAHHGIPENALKINVQYDDSNLDIRVFDFIDNCGEYEEFLNKMKNEMEKL